VVVGGGITGLQTAYLLKLAGARVVVLEAGRIAMAVSGHTTAKITVLHGLTYQRLRSSLGAEKASLYAHANKDALERIVTLVQSLGIDCGLMRQPAYTYADTEERREDVEREVEAAQQTGLPATFVPEVPLPFATGGAVRLDGQACFHPRQYLLALAERIDGDGSVVFEGTQVRSLDDEACAVRTESGSVKAEHIVLATHFPAFDHSLFSARMTPRRSYVLAVRLDEIPVEGMFISSAADYRSLRHQETPEGTLVLAGGRPHRTGEGGDTRTRYEDMEQWTRANFPVRDVVFRWSTQDYTTVDDVPYIGRYRPKDDRVLTATGFKGWGMTHSMVAAAMISDAFAGRGSEWASLYDPWRGSVGSSAKAFLAQNIDAAKHLVVGRIVAHAHPTCPHMGCTLAYNEAEDSWDCPCHGSRFSSTGGILHGPALDPPSGLTR
jgi:glycine/D-amino acid oxidase-like deaminating enzyme